MYYQCSKGYILHGDSQLTCQADSTWSSAIPKCVPIQCPGLSQVAYGVLSSSNYSFGSVVRITCQPGFVSVGSSSLMCQASKTWNSSLPNCQPVQCPRLLPPTFSQVVRQNNSYQGSAVLNCLQGYRFVSGQLLRFCQKDKTWSGQPIGCQGKILKAAAVSGFFLSFFLLLLFICLIVASRWKRLHTILNAT